MNARDFKELPSDHYRTIYADPPWAEHGGGQIKRGADRHYPLMKTKDIKALAFDVLRVGHDDAHLYLWVTNNFLPAGLEVMEAWGFRYVTCITWAKPSIGIGQYYRGQTEQLLFCVRGKVEYRTRPDGKRAQGSTLVTAPKLEHSVKPESVRQTIELVSHGPRLEMFARRPAKGWDTWGNHL